MWSRTIVHRAGHRAWQSEVPYVVALVRLEEGPVLLTNLVDEDPGAVEVWSHAHAQFQACGDHMIVVFGSEDKPSRASDGTAQVQERSPDCDQQEDKSEP